MQQPISLNGYANRPRQLPHGAQELPAGAVDLGGTPEERERRRMMSKSRPIMITPALALNMFRALAAGRTAVIAAGMPEGAEIIGAGATPEGIILYVYKEDWPVRLGDVPVAPVVLHLDWSREALPPEKETPDAPKG